MQPYIFDAYAGLEEKVGVELPFVKLILKHFGAHIRLKAQSNSTTFSIIFPRS